MFMPDLIPEIIVWFFGLQHIFTNKNSNKSWKYKVRDIECLEISEISRTTVKRRLSNMTSFSKFMFISINWFFDILCHEVLLSIAFKISVLAWIWVTWWLIISNVWFSRTTLHIFSYLFFDVKKYERSRVIRSYSIWIQ